MAAVTNVRSSILGPVKGDQVRTATNSGAHPVEVSTDKHFNYGSGIRIAAGDDAEVIVHKGESLYAISQGGNSTIDFDFGTGLVSVSSESIAFGVEGEDPAVLVGYDPEGEVVVFNGGEDYIGVRFQTVGPESDGAGDYTDISPGGVQVHAANGGLHSFGQFGLAGKPIADPVGVAGYGRLYFKSVGGKIALAARFPSGAVQQIAIEP